MEQLLTFLPQTAQGENRLPLPLPTELLLSPLTLDITKKIVAISRIPILLLNEGISQLLCCEKKEKETETQGIFSESKKNCEGGLTLEEIPHSSYGVSFLASIQKISGFAHNLLLRLNKRLWVDDLKKCLLMPMIQWSCVSASRVNTNLPK